MSGPIEKCAPVLGEARGRHTAIDALEICVFPQINRRRGLRSTYREAAPRVREQICCQRAFVMWVPLSHVSMHDFISAPRAPSRRATPPEAEDGCCVADRSDGLLA